MLLFSHWSMYCCRLCFRYYLVMYLYTFYFLLNSGMLSTVEYTIFQEWFDYLMANEKPQIDLIGLYLSLFSLFCLLQHFYLIWIHNLLARANFLPVFPSIKIYYQDSWYINRNFREPRWYYNSGETTYLHPQDLHSVLQLGVTRGVPLFFSLIEFYPGLSSFPTSTKNKPP